MSKLFNFIGTKKIGSRGAVSLIIAMVVLSVVLAIALGSSFIISNGLSASSSHADSVVAYYAAETGIEQALFDHKTVEPTASRCQSGCSNDQISGGCCPQVPPWSTVGNASYCIKVSETTACDRNTITSIQSIGEYHSTRRSVNINF